MFKPFKPVPEQEYSQKLDPDEAYFYHTIELPGIGLRRGHWDLRGAEDRYLGNVSVAGKTVFDCGVASGFMAFAMEQRGATVTGLDLDIEQSPDMGLIPYADYQSTTGMSWQTAIEQRHKAQKRLRNSFLIGRQAFRSNVDLMLGNIMYSEIEADADIALFGSILLHLRDPIAALYNVAKHVRETIIVTETLEVADVAFDRPSAMLWRPSITDPRNVGTWWYLSPALLKRVLECVGFRTFSIEQFSIRHDLNGNIAPHFALVAKR